MARRSSGGRGRGGSWLTACFFPSSSGTEHGDALNPEKCTCVYVVTADYQRQEKTEISLTAGEKVEVIEKSESGWWFVRTAEEQGWVPATYLVSLTGRRESHKSLNGEPEWYVTVQSFSSSSQDELGFKSGVIVEVIQRNLEGWWFIRYGGKEGWAPAAYLKKIQNGVTSSNQATENNKPAVQGQVEIIGNLMEISNLLNKKPINHTNDTSAQLNGITSQHSTSSDSNVDTKNTHNDRDSNSTTSSVSHSDCEDPVSQQKDKSPSISVSSVSGSDAGISSSLCVSSSLPSSLKNKTIPPSPAIARVVPQRFHSVETKSASYSHKPPPRRENSLGFQLPEPPEPPTVEAEYYTIAEFRSCLTDGISFSGGQKAEVIEKNSGGWWYVQIGEKEGWAPCSYIDKRKKPSLIRQTSTLTRPKVPPPAPPIKKQNSLSCVESVVMSSESLRIYEEPEYDVPTIGLEIDAELEFLPGDGPTKAPPPLSQRKVSFTLGGGDGEDYDGVYAIGGFRDENSPSGTHRVSMYDPPEYDAPTIEPSIETTAVYAHSKHSTLKQQADELKSKPSVLPKPTNPECGSLRRPPKSTQPEQHFPYRGSRTSEESANCFSSEDTMGFHNSAPEAFNEESCVLYRTTMAYQREEPCELSFPAGVQVEVLEKQESGWWFVRWGNEEGWVPTYYLQPIKSSDKSELEDSDKVEPSSCWTPTPDLEIAVQVDVANVGKSILEKNEQRVSQSLKVSHRSNQQNCRVGVKQLAVRPQNVLMTQTKDKTNGTLTNARTTQRNDTLPNQTSFHSYTDQSTSSAETMRRKVPISMVKPKPHLIHNNLREEYVSIADYHGDAETMSFPAGTRLEVLERNPNGWWYCRVLDSAKLRKGWVPSNFLDRKS